jgi:hypothetical protein
MFATWFCLLLRLLLQSSFSSLVLIHFRTVSRHAVLGRPLFLVPCGLYSSAAFVISLGGFLRVCPIHFHFRFYNFFSYGLGAGVAQS